MVVAGLMQFYFLGSAQFMQDMGISSKHVPASMALAQIAQAAATFFLLGMFLDAIRFQMDPRHRGRRAGSLMYVLYVIGKPRRADRGPAAAWPGIRVLHDRRADLRRIGGP